MAIWAIVVAFMLGIHNFYKGEDKSLENIVKIELVEVWEDNQPKENTVSVQTGSTDSPGTPAAR